MARLSEKAKENHRKDSLRRYYALKESDPVAFAKLQAKSRARNAAWTEKQLSENHQGFLLKRRKRSFESAEQRRAAMLKRVHGITPQLWEIMAISQDYKCAICGTDNPGERHISKRLHVDHCHNSKRIRGLLCTACNQGLGMFRDNIELLKKCIAYLNSADEVAHAV